MTIYPEMAEEIKSLIQKTDRRLAQVFRIITDRFVDGQMITYNQLKTFPICMRMQLAEGVYTKRLPLPPASGLYFQVDFQKERELGAHLHDCFEHITVERGCFIDLATGKIYEEGDELLVAPKSIHNIKSLDKYTILYILFSKDDPY